MLHFTFLLHVKHNQKEESFSHFLSLTRRTVVGGHGALQTLHATALAGMKAGDTGGGMKTPRPL